MKSNPIVQAIADGDDSIWRLNVRQKKLQAACYFNTTEIHPHLKDCAIFGRTKQQILLRAKLDEFK